VLAAAEPVGYGEGGEPARLADDGGGPRLPGYAAFAQIAARRRWKPLHPEPAAKAGSTPDPEAEAVLADSVGYAITLVVLNGSILGNESLLFCMISSIFVLRRIARITGRTPEAARQLAAEHAGVFVESPPCPRANSYSSSPWWKNFLLHCNREIH